ncbi:hypothetical protein NI17_007490 [Thermobifida halotolerans]|uniref:Low molecular weight antigen MTB12-like C-terminal domain-containing protein n=1 Tax=Thermobifida halotolerans TaxID=483545 RepID=A0A399G928_9ACTN|nr:hypothetical protein [Thermobifida halotolerans]UOE20997.1 hypothetical protein NI17_007490 [Thermobifida halotolerans]
MRRFTLAACLAALTLAAGCGSEPSDTPEAAQTSPTASVNPLETPVLEGEDEEGARAAAETYIEAVRTADGQVGCFVLTEEARRELVETHGGDADCAEAFSATLASPDTTATVETVELGEDGTTATAHLTHDGSADDRAEALTLVNIDGAWLVDSTHPL